MPHQFPGLVDKLVIGWLVDWSVQCNPIYGPLFNSPQLSPLIPATQYVVRVVAMNQLGRSPPSEPLHLTTGGERPEAAPRGVTAEALGPTQVHINIYVSFNFKRRDCVIQFPFPHWKNLGSYFLHDIQPIFLSWRIRLCCFAHDKQPSFQERDTILLFPSPHVTLIYWERCYCVISISISNPHFPREMRLYYFYLHM